MRLYNNIKILIQLFIFFIKYRDRRFIQGLWNLNIIEPKLDKFYQESEITLYNLSNRIKALNNDRKNYKTWKTNLI